MANNKKLNIGSKQPLTVAICPPNRPSRSGKDVKRLGVYSAA
jgi:hypothetical protein